LKSSEIPVGHNVTLSGHPLDTSRFDPGWPKSAFWMSFLGQEVFQGVSGVQTKN